ncbi:MAG: hypothetical protein U9Q81_16365, partial [Pseudomonadota bacterium]|nr:hypothetical protein [Pseudomonadota bacterium]
MTNTSIGARRGPRLLHPLMGCNLGTLLEVLARNGPVPLGSGVPVLLALTAALLRWPFSTVEKLVVRARSA